MYINITDSATASNNGSSSWIGHYDGMALLVELAGRRRKGNI
jgi:hypothetical protein